jgi:hypothetical protein
VENASGGKSAVAEDAALYAMPLADVRAMDADLVEGDQPGKVVGHIHADVAAGKFSYQLDWKKPGDKKNPATDIQEFGWIFTMPAASDHFSWHRQAYWSWYPATHVGRPAGTATPDSADVDVTKITRPDAFDFNSTKYNCDWASLGDSSGHGIGVKFAADGRHHCRSGTAEDGSRVLVVNKVCAPPRDISSGIVPDLYFTVERGAKSTGSFTVGTISSR